MFNKRSNRSSQKMEQKCKFTHFYFTEFYKSSNFILFTNVMLSLCCECGTLIDPNPANMCVACLRNHVDITEGKVSSC